MDFRILGSLEVRDDEGREVVLGAGRQRALLALLLLHENEHLSTERLIDELWGERAPATAAKIVQNHVSQLRRALGDGHLLTSGRGYVLEVEPGSLDLDRFGSLVSEGSTALAGGDPRTASVKLRDALSLWRGAPLAEFAYEPFAQAAIARLEELRLAATEELVDAELALGLHAEVVGELAELVRQNPLRERLRAQLMTALYRSGRQAEALEVYRAGRAALVDELGLEPGEELQELQRAILAHDPRLTPPRRVGVFAPPSRLVAGARVLRRPRVLAALGALLVAGAAAAAAVLLTRGSERGPVVVEPNSVAVVDPRSGGIVGQVRVGSRPVAIAIGQGAVWVANADDGTVTRIDPSTRKIVQTIGTGTSASDIAVGEGAVWVASGSEGQLLRIDPRTNTVVRTILLGGPDKLAPEGVYSVVAGGGAVWVGSGSGAVLKIDPATDREVDRVPVGPTPTDIAFGNGELWVVRIGGRVLRIDPAKGALTGAVAAAPYARAIAAGVGGVWVTDATFDGHGFVWRIDPATVTISGGPTTLPTPPAGVATGGGAVWVAGGSSGTVIEIDPTSGSTRSIRVGNAPLDVAYGGGELWVTVGTREASP
jgi:DNA-binding SARP family transcriptional activator/DNA-binding beta-propeller fold protein YncE